MGRKIRNSSHVAGSNEQSRLDRAAPIGKSRLDFTKMAEIEVSL